MTRTLRIDLVQHAPIDGAIDENLAFVLETIKSSEADLVVFPELFLSGYRITGLNALALGPEDARISALSAQCRKQRVALLLGYVELDGEQLYDAFLAIDSDGTVLPSVRKSHLFGPERQAFSAGDSIEPVTLAGHRIGVINCFEIEFPEIARTLALKGAELLVVGSANMHPYSEDHRTATRARAIENRIPLAYVNLTGQNDEHRFCGDSRILDADGTLLASVDGPEEAVLRGEIELLPRRRDEFDMIGQRRTELYAT